MAGNQKDPKNMSLVEASEFFNQTVDETGNVLRSSEL